VAIPALIAASSTPVGRINLCLIAVDFSCVRFAQADDPQCVAPIDEYDAMEAPTDQAIADLARFALIGAGVGLGQDVVPIEPLRFAQRDTVFFAIAGVFSRVENTFHSD